jgi:ribosomal protein S18 acetylase RimI-like enzyme
MITVRRMAERDLAAGLRLTRSQNWPHRLADWQFHFRFGRGWVACDAGDEVIAIAMWWPYGEAFGTVGLIVVDPAYQNRGIGGRLISAVMNDTGARTLQLIATAAGLPLYERRGFKERGGIEQHQGLVESIPAVMPDPSITLRAMVRDDLAVLAPLDAAAFGGDRRALIGAILDAGRGVVAERNGKPVGFAMMREFGRGTLIGPVVAPDEGVATVLASHLVSCARGFVRIDVPTDAACLRTWLDSVGMPSIDHAVPMVRGVPPEPSPAARVFALISQALN